jgi:hypothetical protein
MKKSIILGMLLLFSSLAGAQEVQVPFDLEGKVTFLNRELEQKLALFPEYETFQMARIFQLPDSSYVLEIYYQPQQTLLKNRLPLSTQALENLRATVAEKFCAQPGPALLDQEGRTKFLVGTMTLSLGYYGWAVPMALDVDDGKLALALYMLTSGNGFYLPYSWTAKNQVTDAAATLSLYCASRGILHGWMLTNLLVDNPSVQGVVFTGIIASIAEGTAGFRWADLTQMSAGTAETIGTCGDFGIGLGFGMAHLAGFFDVENGRGIAGSILLGSGLGLWSGKMLAQRQNYTRGDASVLSAAGLLGAYLPLTFVDVFKPDNGKAYTTAMILGGIAGLGIGNALVRGRDFSTSQGNYIRLSEYAGGLLGLGLAYLVSSDENDNSTLYLASGAVGATAGFWLMYRANARTALISPKGISMNLQIVPQGLIGLVSEQNYPAPLLDFTLQF